MAKSIRYEVRNHHVAFSNIDLNVVLAGLELLMKSKQHTEHTRQWAEDLYGTLKSMHWNFMPDTNKNIPPKD